MVVTLFVTLLITTLLLVIYNKILFIPCIMLLSSISPIIEKLTDDTMFGANWNTINFYRAWPEFAISLWLTALMVVFIFIKKYKFKIINKYLLLWGCTTFILLWTSTDINRSFIAFIAGIFNPIESYLLVVLLYGSLIQHKQIEITRVVTLGAISFIIIGMCALYYLGGFNDIQTNNFVALRSKTGVWLGNHGVQCMLLLSPFIFNLQKNPLKILYIVLLVFSCLAGTSRTSLFLIFLSFAIFIVKSNKFKYNYMIGVLLFILLLNSTTDYLDFVQNRFSSDGEGVYKATGSDDRYFICTEAFDAALQTPLVGIGLGNFTLFNSYNFSDAHNIYLSIFVETGIFCFLFFIIMLLEIIFTKVKNSESRYLKYGFVLFMLNGFTGSQFFTISGFVSGIMGITFCITLALFNLYNALPTSWGTIDRLTGDLDKGPPLMRN